MKIMPSICFNTYNYLTASKFHILYGVLIIIFFMSCRSVEPLGDGTLEGRIPYRFFDSGRYGEDIVLILNDDTEPLPQEIAIRRIKWERTLPSEWEFIKELEIQAPQTPVGEGWIENTRRVRRYRRFFKEGYAFEADIDVQLCQTSAEMFLRSLRLTKK